MPTRGVNIVVLLGHLTNDAQKIETENGFGCTYTVAVNQRFRKRDGSWIDTTNWIPCIHWNAMNVFQYLEKGRQVSIRGTLKTTRKEQQTLLEVSVDELILTDSKPGDAVDPELEQQLEKMASHINSIETQNHELRGQIQSVTAQLAIANNAQASPRTSPAAPRKPKPTPAASKKASKRGSK